MREAPRHPRADDTEPGAAPAAEPTAPMEAIDLTPLRRLVGFNIHILDLMIYQLFYEHHAEPAMTPGVFSTLLAISHNPGVRHGALADALLIQRPNMTKLINRLERDGFVRRRPSRADGRSVVLHLTGRGRQAVERVTSGMLAHDERAAAGLTAAERQTLLALLGKLADGLRRRPAAQS